MTSVMRQVSNNPAVATQFFKTTNPDNLKYMLFDRQDLEAAPLSTVLPEMTKVDAKALRDAAGDAFQAGVTGMNPNDPNAKYVPHNPEQQKLFERSLEMLASSGDKVPEHLRDNTAKVLANYGDQVHTSMSSESQGDGVLDRKQLLEVTRQVSRDPESYSVLNAAMNQWIIQDISSSTTGDIGTLDNAGQTIGFLEEARYQAREMDKEDFAEDPNRKLGIQILDAATAQLPYGAGDVVGIFTGTVIDGWQRDEQNRIDDNFEETSTANFEGREQQLKELAKAWEEVNSEHPLPNSQSNPETRIQEAADAGINRAASLGGKQT
jgi:hypothetical protein